MSKKCYKSECDKIIEKEIGYLEKKSNKDLDSKTKNAGNKNYTKYSRDIYEKAKNLLNGNKQAKPYCAVGEIWVICEACDWDIDKVRKVLCLDGSVDDGKAAAGVNSLKAYFKAKKRYDKKAEAGALIFFNYGGDKDVDHVGRVKKVTSTKVDTIEFNTTKDGKGGVWEKSYNINDKKIDGYGHPKYDKEPEPEPTPTPEPPKPTPTPTPEPTKKTVKATESAKSFDKYYAKSYKVNTSADTLNMRNGAGLNYSIMTKLPKGASVRCYGYYTDDWLYVRYETKTTIYEGFCNKKYLKG
jgi:hypothetical protein